MGKDQNNNKGESSYYRDMRVCAMTIIERSFGTLGAMVFCEANVLKYRLRLGKKEDQPIERELRKINWYQEAAKYYKDKLDTENEIIINNRENTHLTVN